MNYDLDDYLNEELEHFEGTDLSREELEKLIDETLGGEPCR